MRDSGKAADKGKPTEAGKENSLDRLRALLHKIVSVPKSEVDEVEQQRSESRLAAP